VFDHRDPVGTTDASTNTTEACIETCHDARPAPAPRRARSPAGLDLHDLLGGSMGSRGRASSWGPGRRGRAAVPARIRSRRRPDPPPCWGGGRISAIFKAPVTGTIFALEVPYRDDLARRALLPAIFAAASGSLTSAGFVGWRPRLRRGRAGCGGRINAPPSRSGRLQRHPAHGAGAVRWPG
jgi:CIC family chloride channel protein